MFLVYENGEAFWQDNEMLLKKNRLETVFFESNAKELTDSRKGFAVKVEEGSRILVALSYLHHPMVLFGDPNLCASLAEGLIAKNLSFQRVLGKKELTEEFLKQYERRVGGHHQISHQLAIMTCSVCADCNTDMVEQATLNDVDAVFSLLKEASKEMKTDAPDYETILSQIHDFAVIRKQGTIISLAKRVRQTSDLCAISAVFTVFSERGKGLARKTVTYLTKTILKKGKIPYLFVDQSNPVSNHLYLSIGYRYAIEQIEISYCPFNK